MKNTELYKGIQSNLQKILDLAEPTIDNLVEKYIEHMLNKDRPYICSDYDISYYRISVVIDLIKALSKYIKSTDLVDVNSFSTASNGSITIRCIITRDSVKYNMSTEMIYAGGYNIQQLHYRYISHTVLPASVNKNAIELLQARRNKLTKKQKITKDIEYTNKWYKRDLDNFNNLKKMTFEEVISNSYLSKSAKTYDDLSDGGKENFHYNPKEFEDYQNNLKNEIWKNHLNRTKDSVIKERTKEYEKQMLRHNNKLKSLEFL